MTKKQQQPQRMTYLEAKWAHAHAKEHAIEALKDVGVDEAHSILRAEGNAQDRGDIRDEVLRHLDRWIDMIRSESFKNQVPKGVFKKGPPK